MRVGLAMAAVLVIGAGWNARAEDSAADAPAEGGAAAGPSEAPSKKTAEEAWKEFEKQQGLKESWISKGAAGGAGIGELWILQAPAGTAPSSGEAGDAPLDPVEAYKRDFLGQEEKANDLGKMADPLSKARAADPWARPILGGGKESGASSDLWNSGRNAKGPFDAGRVGPKEEAAAGSGGLGGSGMVNPFAAIGGSAQGGKGPDMGAEGRIWNSGGLGGKPAAPGKEFEGAGSAAWSPFAKPLDTGKGGFTPVFGADPLLSTPGMGGGQGKGYQPFVDPFESRVRPTGTTPGMQNTLAPEAALPPRANSVDVFKAAEAGR